MSGVWGERTSERAKAVELWFGRERLSVRGSVDVGSPLSALGASDTGRLSESVCCVRNVC